MSSLQCDFVAGSKGELWNSESDVLLKRFEVAPVNAAKLISILNQASEVMLVPDERAHQSWNPAQYTDTYQSKQDAATEDDCDPFPVASNRGREEAKEEHCPREADGRGSESTRPLIFEVRFCKCHFSALPFGEFRGSRLARKLHLNLEINQHRPENRPGLPEVHIGSNCEERFQARR